MDIPHFRGIDRLGQADGSFQRHGDFPRNAQDALAVGTVGGDREIDDYVVHPENFPHIGANRTAFMPRKNQDTVHFRPGIIRFLQAKLLARAEHPVGGNAPQLPLLDMRAVRQVRIVQGDRHHRALKHVVRAGHDLNRLLPAHIQLADLQPVGVGMLFQPDDPAGHHIIHGLGQVVDPVHLKTAHDHFIAKLLQRDGDIHIPPQPVERYFHAYNPPFCERHQRGYETRGLSHVFRICYTIHGAFGILQNPWR